MCGRYNLKADAAELAQAFDLNEAIVLPPRYNIAPTQAVLVVRWDGGRRQPALMRWGLIPSWAKDAAIGNKTFNARLETLAEKPSFRTSFRRRRCLVPASGYYEWQQQGKRKQPYHFIRPSGQVFAFAGLWDRWLGADGSDVETVTIVTMDANESMQPYHHRMPVVVDPAWYGLWFDHGLKDLGRLQPVWTAAANVRFLARPVGPQVGDVRLDGPELLARVDLAAASQAEAPLESGTQLSLLDL